MNGGDDDNDDDDDSRGATKFGTWHFNQLIFDLAEHNLGGVHRGVVDGGGGGASAMSADRVLSLDGVTCMPSKAGGSTLWHFRCGRVCIYLSCIFLLHVHIYFDDNIALAKITCAVISFDTDVTERRIQHGS